MYKKATVLLDGPRQLEYLLSTVEGFIRRFNLSDVTLVRVVEPEEHCVFESSSEANESVQRGSARRSSAEDYLTQFVNQISYDGTKFHAEVIAGNIPQSFTDFVKRNNTDVVLIITHGFSALAGWFRGNSTGEFLHSVKVPVYVV